MRFPQRFVISEKLDMRLGYLKILAALIIGSMAGGCQSSGHADITPAQAVAYANAFTMGFSVDAANNQAEASGFTRQTSESIDALRVVSYRGPTKIKLIFGKEGTLTAVLVHIRKGADEDILKRTLRELEQIIGSPSKVWGTGSDFLAGVNFETSVYAQWPLFLLSHQDEVIWLERNVQ